MNVKFLNPFVEAAAEVLDRETGEKIQRGELALENGAYVMDDVTVIIALVGAVEGNVFYSMSQTTAIQLASKMMSETLTKLDGLAQSGIAELSNVITGRAGMKLAEAGFRVTISPPSLLLGKGATISTLDFPRIVVPLITRQGEMIIHLALRQGASNEMKISQMVHPPIAAS